MVLEGSQVTELPDFEAEGGDSQGEVIPHPPAATERSLARRIALQVLYEVDSVGHKVGEVLSIHLSARQVSRKTRQYTRRLVMGTIDHRTQADKVIRQYATEWPIEQMAIVDRNILRIAIFELAAEVQIPIGVVIDEAVTLASLYGADGSTSFINGVLGALVSDDERLQQLRLESGDSHSSEESEE